MSLFKANYTSVQGTLTLIKIDDHNDDGDGTKISGFFKIALGLFHVTT